MDEFFKPEIPAKKFEDVSEDCKKIFYEVFLPYVKKMSHLNFGVEGSLEIIESLIDKGYIKILWATDK